MLSDTDRIRNLLGEYCWRIDTGDFAGVGELFAHGALASEDGFAFATGADAVEAWYAGGTQLHDGSPRTKHIVADTVIDDPAADGSVQVRSSYVVLQAVGANPPRPIITGRYIDTFRQGDAPHGPGGTWYFAERRFIVDLLGDLSHHWGGPTG